MADVAVEPIAESPQIPEPVRWSFAHRLAFRLFCCYWLLYALPGRGRVSIFRLLDIIPKAGSWLIQRYTSIWRTLAPWVATRFFHVTGQPATYFRTGSGDTTLHYIENLLYVLIALAATAVSGCAEVLGGLLLLFRRTTTLGAMVSAAVMLNVAALNYCYDVPVKLYSTNLFLMAVFLLAPDARRVFDVLVLQRAAAAPDIQQVSFQRRWASIAATAFWVLFVGFELFSQVRGGWQSYKQFYVNVSRPPLYGLYDVESGAPQWRKVAVDFPQSMGVRTAQETVQYVPTEYSGNTVTLSKSDRLTFSHPDPDHVVLEGTLNGAAATIRLKKIDTSKMLLVSRGFHWINEFPFNR